MDVFCLTKMEPKEARRDEPNSVNGDTDKQVDAWTRQTASLVHWQTTAV